MLSPSDTLIIFVVALLLFGPEQLPKVARWLGDAMRSMQNTTHSFMLEMERAAAAEQPASAPPAAARLAKSENDMDEEPPTLPEGESYPAEPSEAHEPDEPAG